MKLIEVSIRRKVTIAMFTIAILLFGIVSFYRLKVNLLPDLTYPSLTIRTEYTGAAPQEVENLITKPIEEALGVVKNVVRIRSISRFGESDVTLDFAWGTNMDYANMDVRGKMDALYLPLDVKKPTILRFDPSFDPVMRFGFYRENKKGINSTFDEEGLKYLRRFADEEIKKDMETALGVASVKISGGLEDEILVSIDESKLAQIRVSIERISFLLRAENVNLSGGKLEEGSHQFLIRTLNQFQSIEEICNVIISSVKGKPIYLKDVATIKQGYKEREAITRMNGIEAVEIAVYKEGDANTVSVSREVEKKLKRIREALPKGLILEKVYDQSNFITQSVNEVIKAGIIGGILAIFILYFFLRNFGTTLIISLSIPVSIIATFNLMYGFDLSLNIMSLGGITLGIGMLLDNSIVVLENISRHRDLGKGIKESAEIGASEVSRAIMASTFTTIAVFFPLVFVKGIAGQLFRDQALTVTFALLASLVVALTLIPMLASIKRGKVEQVETLSKKAPKTLFGRFFRKIGIFLFSIIPQIILKGIFRLSKIISKVSLFLLKPAMQIFNKVYELIEKVYPKMLEWALNNKGIVILIAFVLFGISMRLIPILGVELIPQLSQGEFNIEFRLPPGTPLEKTDEVIAKIQDFSTNYHKVITTFSVAGSGNRLDLNPEHAGENYGELTVIMAGDSKRADEEITMNQMRDNLSRIPGLKYKFSHPTLFSFQTPIEVEISGYNLTNLKTVSSKIVTKMKSYDRFTDVKSSMELGQPEIQIYFDREKAAFLGLEVYKVAEKVVNKLKGNVATKYSWHDRKIDILVKAREEDFSTVDDLKKMIVSTENDKQIRLQSIASIEMKTAPGEIRRSDQQRVALIACNLKYGDLGTAAQEIAGIINSVNLPEGINVRIAGQNQEMKVSFNSLKFALLLAIFLVYLVMASQFESFVHPFVIIFTIPLALIGAVLALYVTENSVSVVVFIGAILLSGIVVNNAIVLIDLINQLRSKGMEKYKAIIEGGRLRLRAILMTTITTILGLFPLALGIGKGAELRSSMAITVIGGLAISTLLTLIVIPVVYSILDRKRYSTQKLDEI